MRNSESRISGDMIYTKTIAFVNLCRAVKETHFTRIRKMSLDNLMLSILFSKGRTLQMELRGFTKLLALKDTISKVGYLKQRLKLNPLAFLGLAKHHATHFYKDTPIVKKKNGYLILAVDGSLLNIPTTEENLTTFGNASNKNTKPQAQLGISCLYDTLNRMFVDCSIHRWKFNERAQVILHLNNSLEVIDTHPSVVICDRGYPSGELFIDLMERQQKFLFRLSSFAFKQEQKQMKNDDCLVEIVFDKTRINPHRGTPTADKLVKVGSIHLRFVRLLLQSDEFEYFATNLTNEEFSTKEIGELYNLRWGIETVYDDLKNKLCIENFTGIKPILLEQDIYATLYLSNIMNDIMLEAQLEMGQEEKHKGKHVMAINKNIAIGIMKEELIHLILEKSDRRRKELMDAIVNEIKSNLLPIRKGRHFPRTIGMHSRKYFNSRKKSY